MIRCTNSTCARRLSLPNSDLSSDPERQSVAARAGWVRIGNTEYVCGRCWWSIRP